MSPSNGGGRLERITSAGRSPSAITHSGSTLVAPFQLSQSMFALQGEQINSAGPRRSGAEAGGTKRPRSQPEHKKSSISSRSKMASTLAPKILASSRPRHSARKSSSFFEQPAPRCGRSKPREWMPFIFVPVIKTQNMTPSPKHCSRRSVYRSRPSSSRFLPISELLPSAVEGFFRFSESARTMIRQLPPTGLRSPTPLTRPH